MRAFMKAIQIFLAAAMLLAMVPPGAAQAGNGTAAALNQDLAWTEDQKPQPADRPAEAAMKNLFEKGIGDPWVGGEPFSSGMSNSEVQDKACPVVSYQLLGFLNVTTGLIIATDSGSSMRLIPGAGAYPVYGYFEEDKMTGIFIDFNSTLVA